MTRRVVSLLLPMALALFTAQFAQAQRGGGHGGASAAHFGAGSFAGGQVGTGFRGGAFSQSFSRSPQVFRSPSLSLGSLYRGPGASRSFGYARPSAAYGQAAARLRSNYPAAYSSQSRQPYRNYRRFGYGQPYFYGYGYGNYLGPNFAGYPFGYGPFLDSFFDDGYEQGDGSASQQADYAPPEDYGPQQAFYPSPDQQPSDGYRPAYGNSGALEPLPPQPPTTLIFQDGRPTEQVRNYVLTKTTLYALDADGRRDIPLGDLNLPATIAANRSAGIDFSLPAGY